MYARSQSLSCRTEEDIPRGSGGTGGGPLLSYQSWASCVPSTHGSSAGNKNSSSGVEDFVPWKQ